MKKEKELFIDDRHQFDVEKFCAEHSAEEIDQMYKEALDEIDEAIKKSSEKD